MHVGVIADLHGNLPALRAVLEAMGPVDLLLCAGDVVGYYPDANEVCEAVRARGVIAVRGNHDALAVGTLRAPDAMDHLYRTEWTANALSATNRAWLASLPAEREIHMGRHRILLRHANPWDEETYLYLDSPAVARMRLEEDQILLVGHTHHPGVRRVAGGGLLANPGSVGQPRDYDPRPSYAILDAAAGMVGLHRAVYDVTAYCSRLRDLDWPAALIAILGRHRPGARPADSLLPGGAADHD